MNSMRNKAILLLIVIVLISIGIGAGIYFLGKTSNRTASASKATAVSQVALYPLTFQMTDAFADFLYERGFWKNDGIRINKQKPAQKVGEISVMLRDKAGYRDAKDSTLPIIVTSAVKPGQEGEENTYVLEVFVDTEYVKRYSKKDLEHNIFLAVLSQIYEDTARAVTSYEGRIAKSAQITKLAEAPGANPLSVAK